MTATVHKLIIRLYIVEHDGLGMKRSKALKPPGSKKRGLVGKEEMMEGPSISPIRGQFLPVLLQV